MDEKKVKEQAADILRELGSWGITEIHQATGIIMYLDKHDRIKKDMLLRVIGADEDYRGNGSPVNDEKKRLRAVVNTVYSR